MTTYRREPRNAESQVRGVMTIAWIIDCRQRRMLRFSLVIAGAIALKSRREKCRQQDKDRTGRVQIGSDSIKSARRERREIMKAEAI